ncbi:MAG: beta-lactamase family protein [Acidobacteria bacterium]|nr:beta-lactamase family protein [Acidobacteriota bacterium]
MRKLPEISAFLETRIEAGDFPSAVYLVAEKGEIVFEDAIGKAVVEPVSIPARVDTIYDVASLTKVLVTTILTAKLIENGTIGLNDPLAKFLPEFDSGDKRDVTFKNLLVHDSGFRAWLPFYLLTDDRSEVLKIIAAEPRENPVGTKIVYSDLNFLALTFVIERIYGRRIDEVAKSEIFEPLGLRDTFYNPPAEIKNRIAASEIGNEYERKTCIDLGYEISDHLSPFREQIIWGEVHDGNCWFMGGVSGHAGLFSTAVEIREIAKQFLAKESVLLQPGTCGLFRTNLTPGLNEARAVGFQLAETPESTASRSLSADSFGHLGFTGTSLWIEPETARIFILLTNRTHAHALPFVLLNSVRRRFHELAVADLGR